MAAKQPGTCMRCHAPVYAPYKKLGGGDLIKGFEVLYFSPHVTQRQLTCPSHALSAIPPRARTVRRGKASRRRSRPRLSVGPGIPCFECRLCFATTARPYGVPHKRAPVAARANGIRSHCSAPPL